MVMKLLLSSFPDKGVKQGKPSLFNLNNRYPVIESGIGKPPLVPPSTNILYESMSSIFAENFVSVSTVISPIIFHAAPPMPPTQSPTCILYAL
jgi:hypothetical protein